MLPVETYAGADLTSCGGSEEDLGVTEEDCLLWVKVGLC